MSVEEFIIEYLSKRLSVPVYGDVPDLHTVNEFVTVEKIGSSVNNHIYKATVAVQSWSTSRARADALNERVKPVMAAAVELPELSRCQLTNDYNFPALASKRPRYQALFEVTYNP